MNVSDEIDLFVREALRKQAVYEETRRRTREGWWVERIEDFCARKEVDPVNGRFLFDFPELR